MRAYLIDPWTNTISEVDYSGDYHHIYDLIDAHLFDVVRIDENGDGVFFDDEGLFKEEQAFFKIEGCPQPLAGKGLVLGADNEGNSVQPVFSLKEIERRITFMPLGTVVEPRMEVFPF